MRLASEAGYVLGAELRACGVDLSFTPVLDLDYGVSKVIGNRAFHRDPRVVAMLARALIQGLMLAGMAACGKHFPGRSEEHTSELQSLMRISYAVFCLKKQRKATQKTKKTNNTQITAIDIKT